MERLDYFEYLSYRHKQELLDKTKQDIQEDIEKKLAGQHKLSKKDEEMYEALNGKLYLLDKTKQDIQEDIEKKLAGQHKFSKKDEEMYEALNGICVLIFMLACLVYLL